jgi:hypothetical protein
MKSFKQIREAKSSSGYDLYHKDFSSAMQHAYAHAKKKGYVVDKNDIDNKVATGPKKPSSGKTNKYILKTNKKNRHAHIQVANLDNKRYELNMYIESTMEEGRKPVSQMTPAEKKKDAERRKAYKAYQKGNRNEEVLDEGFSPKDIKMAVGVASDKRYAGGNMTGAVKAIEKIKRGLSKHKQVAAVLKRQNESVEESVELDENRNLFKDYEQLKKKGKSDSQVQDILLSMLKYKRYNSSTLGKLIGDALRKGTIRKKAPFKMAEEFEPHKMYDPKTGKEYDAKTKADHDKYAKLGYTHDKPEVNEAAIKNVRGKDGKTYALELDMSGRKVTVRTKNQFGDIKTISMKQAAKLFEDSILESAKRDAFRAMGKRGKDSADDDDVKATADDRKAADKNIIVQLRRVADLPKGGVIEFKNGKKVNLKQNLAKAVLMKYNSINRNDQKLKFANMASKSPQDLQKALKLK